MCQCQVLRASRLVFELSSEPSESDLLQHVLVSLFHWVGKGGKEGVEENQEKRKGERRTILLVPRGPFRQGHF